MAETIADQDGTFQFGTAFMVHLPLLPFSALTRSEADMPLFIVVADGYQPLGANNGVMEIGGPEPASGFLSVRRSSLQESVLRLSPVPRALARPQRTEYLNNLNWARSQLAQATGSCAQRSYCRSHALAETRIAIERGAARAKSNQATFMEEQ